MDELPDDWDEDRLRAWLETRPPEDAAIIAHRAAMRVAVLWFGAFSQVSTRRLDLTVLHVLRLNTISGVASKYPTPGITRAALAGSRAALAAALITSLDPHGPLAASIDASRTALDASRAALASRAAFFATVVALDSTIVASRAASDASRFSFATDVGALVAGGDPLDLPLWQAKNPLESEWERSKSVLRTTPGGEFWVNWYQRALDGREQNWPLLHDIALIDDELWQEGGERLDAEIHNLRQRHGIAATENGEIIEQDPETGHLRLVPDTELPDDMGAYARRKIIGAASLFDDAITNQYSALDSDLAMLRRAVNDAGNLPVELFDVCVSATRRLTIRIEQGECPDAAQDPIIADYRDRLRQAGADILAGDPKTQQVLENRNRIEGNDALIEGRETIIAAVKMIEPILTGHLATALPNDASAATLPDVTEADRKVYGYRLSSRTLRVAKWISGTVGGTGAAIIGTKEVLEAIPAIQASPIYQEAIKIILRYLGM